MSSAHRARLHAARAPGRDHALGHADGGAARWRYARRPGLGNRRGAARCERQGPDRAGLPAPAYHRGAAVRGHDAGRGRAAGISFRGAADEIRFAGALPEQLGAGIYLMQLTLAEGGEDGERRDLVLRWQPLDLEGATPDEPPEPETRVLIEGVEGLELAYFGALDRREAPDWWPEWPAEQDEFPGLVRVQVRFAETDLRRWPELVIHPMIDRAALF